ncbi:recombinase family protein [Streptomyces sp. HUAS MG91]|uniref:Recombinase family protein n=1 Tax=Streptomyces tabacisoli TaxID=3156398 RepID=A0AAU8ITB8_9ACTN
MPKRSHTEPGRALGVVRLSNVTKVTTSPGRQRATVQYLAEQAGFTLIGEAVDLGVSARATSPFDRPALGPWLRRPGSYEAVVWSHVDRAVRSVGHMSDLIAWGCAQAVTLVFGVPGESGPLIVSPEAGGATVRLAMDLAYAAEQESRAISSRLTDAHEALRAAGRYGGGLVPFGYRKAPHPSGTGWCLTPDDESASLVHAIVNRVLSGHSLTAVARWLNEEDALVPRDRHALLQGRGTGGTRHGLTFDRFRWTSGTLSKVLRSPSLMGHRVHQGRTVLDGDGRPVLIGAPVLDEGTFRTLQDLLTIRSNGTRRTRRPTSALLTRVAHCAGCGGRMYYRARKPYPYGDYVCAAPAKGLRCPAAAAMRSDWLEGYTVESYRAATGTRGPVSRADLLAAGARVTVSKGRCGGDTTRPTGPDTSRLAFTMDEAPSSAV